MPYEIEEKEVEPQPMVSIRATCRAAEIGPTLQEILPEVFTYVMRMGAVPSGPPFTRFHSYDKGYADIESGIPVAQPVEGEGRISAGELPGGTVVSTVHTGPYDKLPEAHDALHTWMREKHKESAGAQWEYYLTDPGEQPDSTKLQTELVWPIRDA